MICKKVISASETMRTLVCEEHSVTRATTDVGSGWKTWRRCSISITKSGKEATTERKHVRLLQELNQKHDVEQCVRYGAIQYKTIKSWTSKFDQQRHTGLALAPQAQLNDEVVQSQWCNREQVLTEASCTEDGGDPTSTVHRQNEDVPLLMPRQVPAESTQSPQLDASFFTMLMSSRTKSPRMSTWLADSLRETAGSSHEVEMNLSPHIECLLPEWRTLADSEADTRRSWMVSMRALETGSARQLQQSRRRWNPIERAMDE